MDKSEMPEWAVAYLAHADEEGYVPFNHDRRLGQNQYASRAVNGQHGDPNLGEGLRWKGLDGSSYHSILIHQDDLVEYHRRYADFRDKVSRGEWQWR